MLNPIFIQVNIKYVMICCDSLIIPVQSATLAVEGMAEFLRAFHRIKSHANAETQQEKTKQCQRKQTEKKYLG